MKVYCSGKIVVVELELHEADKLTYWLGKMRDIEISIRGIYNPSIEGKVASELKSQLERVLRGITRS